MVFYTSDLHLGHKSVLKCRTMYETVEEMNEALIANWNKKVHKNDTIYILGDLSYRSETPVKNYLERLKGNKYLILGNHDRDWLRKISEEELSQYFSGIDSLVTFKMNKTKITLCHYPMLEWSGSRYASNGSSYLIHGHIHSTKNEIYEYIKKNQPTALNCGVDVNHLEPVTFEELVENNKAWYGRK